MSARPALLRSDMYGRARRARLRDREFWAVLLFERGGGWLRWRKGEAESWEYVGDAHASYCSGKWATAPPVRRFAIGVREWAHLPVTLWRVRREPKNERLCWEEYRPYWPEMMTDPERADRLWPPFARWKPSRRKRAA